MCVYRSRGKNIKWNSFVKVYENVMGTKKVYNIKSRVLRTNLYYILKTINIKKQNQFTARTTAVIR